MTILLDQVTQSMAHAIAAGELPPFHRDPWDRILIAQARIEFLSFVTADAVVESYGVKTLW